MKKPVIVVNRSGGLMFTIADIRNDQKFYVRICPKRDLWVFFSLALPTNLGSIPWLFRWFIHPAQRKFVIPFVVHDHLVGEKTRTIPIVYRAMHIEEGELIEERFVVPGTNSKSRFVVYDRHPSWQFSADILRDLAIEYGGNPVRAWGAWLFVSLWGGIRKYLPSQKK